MAMTFYTQTSQIEPLRSRSTTLIALGVLYVVLGLFALGSIVWATAASVLVVGIMMVIAGIGEVIGAFEVRSWGSFILIVILGILFIVAGYLTIQNPLLAATALTLALGASLVASGIVRMIMAFSLGEGGPWIWVLLSGVITLLLGLIILARWPVSSLYTLGIFLGVDLLIVGLSWVAAGTELKQSAAPA